VTFYVFCFASRVFSNYVLDVGLFILRVACLVSTAFVDWGLQWCPPPATDSDWKCPPGHLQETWLRRLKEDKVTYSSVVTARCGGCYEPCATFTLTQVRVGIQGVPEKIAQSLCTTILQPYITESCSLQQNVQKEIVYTIKASVWIWQLNILCFATGK